MSNAEFRANFAKVLAAAGERANDVVRKTALQMQSSMVAMSPVDTGRFKGNWQAAVGAVDTTTSSGPDKGGAAAIGRTTVVLETWKPGQTIFLTNSMPYATRLENGWSGQAPGGMVRLTVQNFGRSIERAARNLP